MKERRLKQVRDWAEPVHALDADEMFKLLNKAYSVLKDRKKREAYNHELMAEIFQQQIVDPARQRFSRFGYTSDVAGDEWGWRVG